MTRTIVLDAGPLGMLCHPNLRGDSLKCQQWAEQLELNGARLVLPEIVDYEVRRELIRGRRARALAVLDRLRSRLEFVKLDSAQILHAAQLWAQVRNLGLPTAGPESLDADAILGAQALSLNDPGVVVATTNPRHLSRFVRAEVWQNVPTT